MTEKEFCNIDTQYYGELVDNVNQIVKRTFNGIELKEYVEHCIELYLLNMHVVSQQSELLKAFYAYVDDKWALGMLTDKVDEVIEGFEKSL